MKILVTGSSGLLGREIVKQLKVKKYDVIGVDIVMAETTDRILDIQNVQEIEAITKGVEVIIHTAALHGKHYEQEYPRESFIRTNIDGTFNLLQSCVKNNVRKLIYTSTTSIYGKSMVNPEQAVWVDETLLPDPRDIYDITKWTAELLCRDFFEKEGIETTVLRVSRFLPEPDNLKVIHRLYRGLDESDGAHAHILTLEKKFDNFQIYNISNDSPFQKEDLKNLMIDPKQVILKYYPDMESIFKAKDWQFPNKIDRVYSIEKAKRELGYCPVNNFINLLP